MKITVPIPTEVEISLVRIVAAVNYGEEEIPNDFPGRTGDTWKADIEMDTGKIVGWPKDFEAEMHLTVKDAGSYYLLDATGKQFAARENNYVPHEIIPGSYGDTIELNIAADGTVKNWPSHPDVGRFLARNAKN